MVKCEQDRVRLLGYVAAVSQIEQHCTQALNILDRFHIVAKMNKALDKVRASEARQLVRDRIRAATEEDPVPAQTHAQFDRSPAYPAP